MELVTYEDALTRLKRFLGGTHFARSDEDVKVAVDSAYQGLCTERKWHYYNSIWGFNTQAPVESTGTYVHSTRKLTMATATPSWVLTGAISMDGIVADVESLNTATNPSVMLMGTDRNFGQNYATSTSLTLYQEHITLPDNFRDIDVSVAGDAAGRPLSCMSPSEYVYQHQFGSVTGDPTHYCIMQDPENLGRTALFLYPAPAQVRTYRVAYRKKPRDLWYTGTEAEASETGTVTISAAAAITGSSTAFASRMAGSVFRVSSTANTVPTDKYGTNRYAEQGIIKTYTSATSLTLASAFTGTYSSARFVISDPVDIDPIMIPAFYARCRLELARLRTDTHLREQLPMLESEYERLLLEAKNTDNKISQAKQTGGGRRAWDWTNMRYSGDVG